MSNSATRKFVFKKRSDSEISDPVSVAISADDQSAQETTQTIDEAELHFSGEIFDQYYRPLSIEGGEEALREISNEPLGLPQAPQILSRAKRQLIEEDIKQAGEVLAHQIYKLAQKVRETELDVYISAFNVILANRSCEEAHRILAFANEFFTEHYYSAIRERGERPEIYHQILKRTGHHVAERLSKIVAGLDIQATAQKLWDLHNGTQKDKRSRIIDILLDCTPKQVRALRQEFLAIPYRDLARQLHAVLNKAIAADPNENRRLLSKPDPQSQRRASASRSRDELKLLQYILNGRTAAELDLIRGFYAQLSEDESTAGDDKLVSDIKKRLLPPDAAKAFKLLEGWTPVREAQEIYSIIFPEGFSSPVVDRLSDPQDSVDRETTQGIGPFLRRFRKRRIFRETTDLFSRVMSVFPLLEERISYLSRQTFDEVNQVLRTQFDYELDAAIFPSLSEFDPRRIAIRMFEIAEHSSDPFEILKPLQYLTPQACQAVERAFSATTGKHPAKALKEAVSAGRTKDVSKEQADLIEKILLGTARCALNVDLLSHCSTQPRKINPWGNDFEISQQLEEFAGRLAELVHDEQNLNLQSVEEIMKPLDLETRHGIERAFFEMSEPQTALLSALRESIEPSGIARINALLEGENLDRKLERISGNISRIADLRFTSLSSLSYIIEEHLKLKGSHPYDIIIKNAERLDRSQVLDLLSIILKPETFRLRQLIKLTTKDSSELHSELGAFFLQPAECLISCERAFDVAFGSLRLAMKYRAAQERLPIRLFGDAVLLLEGVEPIVIEKINECFDAIDIKGLLEILDQHREHQNIIEEVYDLLFMEKTLRRAIKEMRIDLDHINEALLHLEGHYPYDVAAEIFGLINSTSGEELGSAIGEILALPTTETKNPRLPNDENWTDEMLFQTALAFERTYDKHIIDALRERGVPDEQLESLTMRFYGHEVGSAARDLFNLIRSNKSASFVGEAQEESLAIYLESRGARHRDRMMRAYAVFWGSDPNFSNPVQDLDRYVQSPAARKKFTTLLAAYAKGSG